MLQAAVAMALDPTTVKNFANPSIVTGCVELLKIAIGQRGEVASESPFSFEYGSYCFTIIVVCLDTCLLERLGKTNEALAAWERAPELPAYGTLSIKAAMAVSEQLKIQEDGSSCDWILGFSTPISQPHYSPILVQTYASALINILWDDRWYILKVFGISTLLFLLSRHVFHERYSRNNPDGQMLHTRLYELAMRNIVTSNQYHQVTALKLLDAVSPYTEWGFTSKHMDLRDSRLILTTFISQISRDLNAKYLAGRSPLMMLQFIVLATDPGSQDLLPKVMESIIKYGWAALLSPANDHKWLPNHIFNALDMLIRPAHTPPYQLVPSIQAEIIEIVQSSDLLDITAWGIIRLDPTEASLRSETLHIILRFYESLTDAVSSFKLSQRIWDYVPVWRKYTNHLFVNGYGIPSVVSIEHREHYKTCMQYWLGIGRLLGIEHMINDYIDDECASGRCAAANVGEGARFICAGCTQASYCDVRCQVIDWKFGGHAFPHGRLSRAGLGQV